MDILITGAGGFVGKNLSSPHPHPQLHIGAVTLSTRPSCPSVNTDIALAFSYFLHVHRPQLLLCLFQTKS